MENDLLSARELVECLYKYKDESIRKDIDYCRNEKYIPDKFIEKGSWGDLSINIKSKVLFIFKNLLELSKRISSRKMALCIN